MRTGLDRLLSNPGLIRDLRVGLLTNYTGATRALDRNVEALRTVGVDVVALFGPEHGLNGTAQAGASEGASVDAATGIPIVDTYGSRSAFADHLAQLHVDVVVFDMQDVGARYWTYVSSMFDAMVAVAGCDLRFVVLDRPNPIGGLIVEGPALEPEFASFVGRAAIPQRHGLTVGELAQYFNETEIRSRLGRGIDLEVVGMDGWSRNDDWEDTSLPWIMPSPNIPTPDTALAFAGTGLIEGTNLSEGRGTTRPFELFGAPYVNAELVPALRALDLPGVAFREVFFSPTFHKHAGSIVRGAQLHVVDRRVFQPVATGVSILDTVARLYPHDFAVLSPGPEADDDHDGYALDRLWGSDSLRRALTAGTSARDLVPPVRTVDACYPAEALLYE